MDRSRDTVEETTESVNPRDQGPSVSGLLESVEGDRNALVVKIDALFKISHDMPLVLDRLTAP